MELSWNPGLAVGVGQIDDQHKEIFQRVDELKEALRQNQGSASLTLLLEFLSRYVQQHFSAEEQLMRQHGYPQMAEHLEQHAKFTVAVQKLRDRHAGNGATAGLVMDITDLTSEWLVAHIGKADIELAAFLKPHLAA